MTTTDHAAEARRCIEGLHDYQSEEGMTDESMLTVAIEAQAHATLALAEQQRLANILTLAQFSAEIGGGRRIFTNENAARTWRDDVERALNLEVRSR